MLIELLSIDLNQLIFLNCGKVSQSLFYYDCGASKELKLHYTPVPKNLRIELFDFVTFLIVPDVSPGDLFNYTSKS